MNATLARLITAFRSAQDLAVVTLRDRLGVPIPESNRHWATTCHDLDLPARGRSIGIAIRPHGYGVEITFPAISIDFDWGDHGEAYGFDLWRLWNHCETNGLFPDTLTYNVLKHQFDNACAAGELVADRLLHYLPEERARFAPATTPASSAS
ncbi:MAG: hypothetical protein EOP83_32510 [Verrucomicrobiaceae bacterium]|nr:MAG: hypothetical protein EOP83_32510 [Verrucomicrobiaceae bacterium]